MHLSPCVFLFLNLEWDHTDYFCNIENLIASFVQAGRQSERVLLNLDDENLKNVKNELQNDVITFGFSPESDYRAEWMVSNGSVYPFRLFDRGTLLGEVYPSLIGRHGARNTLAAVALCLEEGIPFSDILASLASFRPPSRRLEPIGTVGGHTVYYDYAHHPTEIAATIEAICGLHQEAPTVLFCPHTYTRTRDLWDGFVHSLRLARRALIAPIFAAREPPIAHVDAVGLAAAVGGGACAVDSPEALFSALGDREPLILMGAGDLSAFLEAVRRRAARENDAQKPC